MKRAVWTLESERLGVESESYGFLLVVLSADCLPPLRSLGYLSLNVEIRTQSAS